MTLFVANDQLFDHLHHLPTALAIVFPGAAIRKLPFNHSSILVRHGASIQLSDQCNLLLDGDKRSFIILSKRFFHTHIEPHIVSSFSSELVNLISGIFMTLQSHHGYSSFNKLSLPYIHNNSTTIGFQKAEHWRISAGEEVDLSVYVIHY